MGGGDARRVILPIETYVLLALKLAAFLPLVRREIEMKIAIRAAGRIEE